MSINKHHSTHYGGFACFNDTLNMAYRIMTNSETYFGVLLHKHAPNYVCHVVWCKVSIRLSHDTRNKYKETRFFYHKQIKCS